MKKIHHHTSEEKLALYSYGEWIEEPDEIIFTHKGLDCKCIRSAFGVWCGYVAVPDNHPWTEGVYYDHDVNIHGGITYGNVEKDGKHWLGFDCGHLGDLSPGIEKHHKDMRRVAATGVMGEVEKTLSELKSQLGIFEDTYRNVGYVIEETRALAEQAQEVQGIRFSEIVDDAIEEIQGEK